jgi:hypothetical protein
MTDPNDDLSSVADPGSMGPDAMTEPGDRADTDLEYDEAHGGANEPSVPEDLPDNVALPGGAAGPPD